MAPNRTPDPSRRGASAQAANQRAQEMQLMADSTVTPGHLEALAAQHDAAADQAQQAGVVTTHLHTKVWKTYGPLFAVVNDAFAHAETQRRDAIKRIGSRFLGQAANLRAAAEAYVNTDAFAAENLDKQVLDR